MVDILTNLSDIVAAIRGSINDSENPAALIFNCHITGLTVARALGRRGVPIIGLDREPGGYGLASRYTTVAGLCPYPLDDEPAFIKFLLEIGSHLRQKAVLFPCLDEWVFATARHRQALEEFYHLPFSSLDIIERLLDKDLLYRKCEASGIPIPRTWYIGAQSPEQIADEISFPCIVKPALQREFTNEFGAKVFRAETRTEFLDLCARAARHPMLAQEIVGAGLDSFYSLCSYLGRDGAAKGVFVGRKLEQYPPDFGTGCLVDARYVSEIAERGTDILRQFGYHGISEVEFIYDERDRDYKLLDVNTRVWKWIGLPIHAGIDLPWLAYTEATAGHVDSVPAPAVETDGLRWIYLKDYISLRRQQPGAPAATLSEQDWVDLIAQTDDRDGRIVPAVYSKDDPRPFARLIDGLFAKRQYYCAC